MATNTNVTNMKFNKLSSSKYGTITPTEGEFYCTPDDNVVHTTGNETKTGLLTLNVNGDTRQLRLKNNDMVRANKPSANKFSGITFLDGNGADMANLILRDTTTNRELNLRLFSRDGSTNYEVKLGIDTNGNPYGTLPLCTTNATTTSTASSIKMATIVTNYKSGANWYRIWSDGWIEQGGRGTFSSQAEEEKTLIKPFSDTNYNLILTNLGHQHNVYGYPKTTSTFLMGMATPNVSWGSGNFSWYAYGY